MSQSQRAVNFSGSSLLADNARNQIMEDYLLNAKTVADQPSRFMPQSSNRDFDGTQTQWDPRNFSQKQPNPVASRKSVKPDCLHLRQTLNMGSARMNAGHPVNIQDDPVPTPTPVAMQQDVINTTTESIEVPAKHELPVHSEIPKNDTESADSSDNLLDPYKHDLMAYAETQIKNKRTKQ